MYFNYTTSFMAQGHSINTLSYFRRVSMNMDPILTLGLSAFLFGGLILIIVSFIYHCLLATLECIDNVVTRFPDSKSHSNPSTVEDI